MSLYDGSTAQQEDTLHTPTQPNTTLDINDDGLDINKANVEFDTN